MPVPRTMFGTVERYAGGYYTIACPDAPSHLQWLQLLPRQMGGAKVGDTVKLGYISTASYGLWNVVKVLRP
jgi:hypothetical protein